MSENAPVILVLGGVRSGKSAVAESLIADLSGGGPVTYLATGRADLADTEFAQRIADHRSRRPRHWTTVEVDGDLAAAVDGTSGPVLVDSVTTWMSADPTFEPDVAALVAALARRREPVVLVSDEVGFGGYPATDIGGRFADALGRCIQDLADGADRVLLVVAGRTLELPPR